MRDATPANLPYTPVPDGGLFTFLAGSHRFLEHRPFAAESGVTTMTGKREQEELISKR
jgi:hypothetical protein